MDATLLDVFLIVFLVSLVPVVYLGARTYLRYRGPRVVTCPETGRPVAVRVDKHHAASAAIEGETRLRLKSCTRWPERADCGQECLSQIETSPERCRVRNMLLDWYADRFCYFCRGDFGKVHWLDDEPALRAADGRLLEWSDIRPETLPDVLATHEPVCWNCYVSKRFYDEYPDLVTERRRERRAG